MKALRRGFVAASTAWAAALPISAYAVGAHHQLLLALALVPYAAGAIVCHQLPERSFHVWGAQLPVCARCTGIYAAAAAVALAGQWLPHAERRLARPAIVLSVVPTAATLLFEWTSGQAPSNIIRALAGVPIGAAVAWVIAGL
jgi:uncharacterized membrane protein